MLKSQLRKLSTGYYFHLQDEQTLASKIPNQAHSLLKEKSMKWNWWSAFNLIFMSYFQCSDTNSTTKWISTICWAMLKRNKEVNDSFSLHVSCALDDNIYRLYDWKYGINTKQNILLNYLPWFDSKHNSIITENSWNLKAKELLKLN